MASGDKDEGRIRSEASVQSTTLPVHLQLPSLLLDARYFAEGHRSMRYLDSGPRTWRGGGKETTSKHGFVRGGVARGEKASKERVGFGVKSMVRERKVVDL